MYCCNSKQHSDELQGRGEADSNNMHGMPHVHVMHEWMTARRTLTHHDVVKDLGPMRTRTCKLVLNNTGLERKMATY